MLVMHHPTMDIKSTTAAARLLRIQHMVLPTGRPAHTREVKLAAQKHGDKGNSLVLQLASEASSEMPQER